MRNSLRFVLSVSVAALLAGAASGAPRCDTPQSQAALRTAALQQYLMVAALTCQRTPAYNSFVLSHQTELQQSDRALLAHFMHRDRSTGDGDYNAYKTWLANASSMRSLHDPQFCQMADAAFSAASDHGKPLAQLVNEQPVPVDLSGVPCAEQSTPIQASNDGR